MDKSEKLLNVPFSSSVNPSFWSKLTEIKLDVDRLQENKRKIWGYFTNVNVQFKPLMEVDSTSFNRYYFNLV